MGKDILFIGVGGVGRRVIEKLNDQNIPNSQCLSFEMLTEKAVFKIKNIIKESLNL